MTLKKISFLLPALLLFGCDKVDDRPLVKTPTSVIIKDKVVEQGGNCAKLAPWGYPISYKNDSYFICHDGFAYEYNLVTRTSNWVVNHLSKENVKNPKVKGGTDLRPDPALKKDIAINLEDYDDDKYKITQLTNSIEYFHSKKETSQSFYLSNTIPTYVQTQLILNLLSYNVLNYANRFDDLYIVSGPVYYKGKVLDRIGEVYNNALVVDESKNNAYLGTVTKGSFYVPTHYFKVIFAPKIKQVKAFLIPNSPNVGNNLSKYEVNMKYVENATGMTFFPQIPEELRQQLNFMYANWGIVYPK